MWFALDGKIGPKPLRVKTRAMGREQKETAFYSQPAPNSYISMLWEPRVIEQSVALTPESSSHGWGHRGEDTPVTAGLDWE